MKKTAMKLGNVLWACVGSLVIQTATADDTIDLVSQPGDYVGEGATVRLSSATGLFTVIYPYSNRSRGVIINYAEATSRWSLVFTPVAGLPLQAGNYENAQRASFASPIRPGIDVSGNGRGCNTKGRFTVREVEYLPSGELSRLALDFEQHCEGALPTLSGTVRLNSTIPPISPQPVAVAGAASEPIRERSSLSTARVPTMPMAELSRTHGARFRGRLRGFRLRIHRPRNSWRPTCRRAERCSYASSP